MSDDTFSEEKLAKMMKTIRGLLDRAMHPSTPEGEAQSCREKADALMFKYRIEEATVIRDANANGLHGNGENGLVPIWRKLTIGNIGSEFAQSYRAIASAVARHCSLRAIIEYDYVNMQMVLKAVGYSSDLMYADVLMTTSLLEFGKRLEPKNDPLLTPQQNALIMRQAGMERKRIAKILLGDWSTENEMKSKNRLITRWVKAEAARQGFDAEQILGRGNNMEKMRESYASGFVSTLNNRLTRMRHMQGTEAAGLVLADRSDRVNRVFYEEYPNLDPANQKPVEPWKDPTEDCERCKKAKSGYCREHSYLRPLKPRTSYGRSYHSAFNRGSDAANAVDLGRNSQGTHKAGSANRGELS